MHKWPHHLRWFDHMERRAMNAPMRKSELIQVKGTKKATGKLK